MKRESAPDAPSVEIMSDQEAVQLLDRIDRALGEMIDNRNRISPSQKENLKTSLRFALNQVEK